MTPNETFLVTMRDAAKAAGHVWPTYAACEAALETAGDALPGIPQSNFGRSETFIKARNIFGNKVPAQRPADMMAISIPTREFLNGRYVTVPADWILFNQISDAFTYRMQLLKKWNMYAPALNAKTGEEFVREVSARWQQITLPPDGKMSFRFTSGVFAWQQGRWSTAPNRAPEVIAIYKQHQLLLEAPPTPPMGIA